VGKQSPVEEVRKARKARKAICKLGKQLKVRAIAREEFQISSTIDRQRKFRNRVVSRTR
jgi:hypothetical protein